ncbi:MAG TPA: hypothetical protein VGQ59_03115 [Cyclobacteriaceae bacterium]|nr:hypothetical protein [Cyclobacteriaceae bacterium]
MLIEPDDFQREYPGKLAEVILGARISSEHEKLIRKILEADDTVIKKASLDPAKYQVIIE